MCIYIYTYKYVCIHIYIYINCGSIYLYKTCHVSIVVLNYPWFHNHIPVTCCIPLKATMPHGSSQLRKPLFFNRRWRAQWNAELRPTENIFSCPHATIK